MYKTSLILSIFFVIFFGSFAHGQELIIYSGADDYYNCNENFMADDYEVDRVIKLSTTGEINIISPTNIEFLDNNSILVNDQVYGKFYKFDINSGKLISKFGKYGVYAGFFKNPTSVVKYKKEFYVADSGNHRIQILDKNFRSLDYFGFLGGRDEIGALATPTDIAVDKNYIYVVDKYNSVIKVFSRRRLRFKKNIGYDPNESLKSVKYPISIDIFENEMVVSDFGKDRIIFFSIKKGSFGKFIKEIGANAHNPLRLSSPMGLSYDHIGNLYIADSENSRVIRMNKPLIDGTISVCLNSDGIKRMIHPVDVKINEHGTIAVLDDFLKEIIIFKADYFKKGNYYYKKHNFTKAVYYLKKAIRDSGKTGNDNIYALFYLGQSYEMLNRLEEAYKIYGEIVKGFSYGMIRSNARFRMKIIKPLINFK